MMTPDEAANLKQDFAGTAPKTAEHPVFADANTADNIATSKTAPTLEEIPTPSILSSGFARPTDPSVSLEEVNDVAIPTPIPEPEIPAEPAAPEPIQIEPEPVTPPESPFSAPEPVGADFVSSAPIADDPATDSNKADFASDNATVESPSGVDQLEDTSASQAAYSGDISLPPELEAPAPAEETPISISKPDRKSVV